MFLNATVFKKLCVDLRCHFEEDSNLLQVIHALTEECKTFWVNVINQIGLTLDDFKTFSSCWWTLQEHSSRLDVLS
jgi:hypothetical protein